METQPSTKEVYIDHHHYTVPHSQHQSININIANRTNTDEEPSTSIRKRCHRAMLTPWRLMEWQYQL